MSTYQFTATAQQLFEGSKEWRPAIQIVSPLGTILYQFNMANGEYYLEEKDAVEKAAFVLITDFNILMHELKERNGRWIKQRSAR